jgi:hypothetical protein
MSDRRLPMTGRQADDSAASRVSRLRLIVNVLAVFVLLATLYLALVLQQEQHRLSGTIEGMCQQRRANAIRSNDYYEGMIQIEKENKVQVASLVKRRIELFEAAKPLIPTC